MIHARSSRHTLPRFPILGALEAFAALARQRRALARLDDAALSDIGVSRGDAQTEAARPVWDAPANWRI